VKNHVKFPKHFKPDYDWNVEFANKVIASALENDWNVYFMPIKVDLKKYFERINLGQVVPQDHCLDQLERFV
jgi:methylenetetrahydrofolate reductase (NADPH)